jgi:hypothetical protein
MSKVPETAPRRVLQAYYAATIVFLMLDYGAGLNVRIAGLEGFPQLKAGYYLVMFACLGVTLWRPGWSTAVGVVESLATLVTLIFSVALRSMFLAEPMQDTGPGFAGAAELVNFLLAGSIAWYAWQRGLAQLFGPQRRHNG